jgi:hypothetical protein
LVACRTPWSAKSSAERICSRASRSIDADRSEPAEVVAVVQTILRPSNSIENEPTAEG